MAFTPSLKRVLILTLAFGVLASLAPFALAKPPREAEAMALTGYVRDQRPWGCEWNLHIDVVPDPASGPGHFTATLTGVTGTVGRWWCGWSTLWAPFRLSGGPETGWSTGGENPELWIGAYGDGTSIPIKWLGAVGAADEALWAWR